MVALRWLSGPLLVVGLSGVICSVSVAQSLSTPSTHRIAQFEAQRQQQRDAEQQATYQRHEQVRLQAEPATAPVLTLAAIGQESPCFPIHDIRLAGQEAERFQFALRYAKDQAEFSKGQCLGVRGLELLSVHAQNAMISRGYITSRVVFGAQDLSQGLLVLTVLPGYVGEVLFERDSGAKTTSRWIQNELPVRHGEVFNLRDLEQGLENYRRLPTVQSSLRIEAADDIQFSDIYVQRTSRAVPLRFSLGVDNSGSKYTGRYLGNVTLAGDGLLGLSDLFYISYNRSLGDSLKLQDAHGNRTRSRTDSYALHYSVPWGYWQLFYNQNYYRYHQAVAGYHQNYDYNGRSLTRELGLSRVLYRDNQRKTSASFKLWQRRSNNYIADAELEVQRKKMGGWQATLFHQVYLGRSSVDVALSYRRGTGLLNSEQPAEYEFGEGTSRMRVITADARLQVPFNLAKQILRWDSRIHAQWHKSPLVSQDQLAIGGRYTVRGFDGEQLLMAERGWYWRNDLMWPYRSSHQLYLGLDVGRVSGPSAPYLLGQSLAGVGLGARGQLSMPQGWGTWHYDVFLGAPLKKATGFKSNSPTIAFSLNYSY